MTPPTPTPSDAYAKIAELVHFLAPQAEHIRIVFEQPGVGRSILAIPKVKTAASPLKPRQLKMMAILAKSPVGLTRKELRSAMTGGKSRDIEGSYGVAVNDLLSRGLIHERDGKLSDTLEKLGIKE